MNINVLRAEELWQQAGAYYVRIQAMARQYHITLREEFDEYDSPEAKYIVLLDDEFPVATCRLYELSGEPVPTVMLGRVVVLPEYRKQGLGQRSVKEAEQWARELGIKSQFWRAEMWPWVSMKSLVMKSATDRLSTATLLTVSGWRRCCDYYDAIQSVHFGSGKNMGRTTGRY